MRAMRLLAVSMVVVVACARVTGGSLGDQPTTSDIALQWPLIDGKVTVADPVPELEDAPASVRAMLEGGEIVTESGLVTLPRIELENRRFNFFAG